LFSNFSPSFPEAILSELVAKGDLQESEKNDVRYVLSRRHTHQYEQVKNMYNEKYLKNI
jgi:hypothetical protein